MDEIAQNVGNETDPKLENLLNLALDATQEELRKSGDLKTGYDPEDNVWELIIKYQGSLDELKEQIPRIRVIPLLRGYAVLYVEQQYVERVAEFENVLYVEKPKRLYFALDRAVREACINSFQSLGDRRNQDLRGRGILVAVLDGGIDYTHPDFRNPDGTTKDSCVVGSDDHCGTCTVYLRDRDGVQQRDDQCGACKRRTGGAGTHLSKQGYFRSWDTCDRHCGRQWQGIPADAIRGWHRRVILSL